MINVGGAQSGLTYTIVIFNDVPISAKSATLVRKILIIEYHSNFELCDVPEMKIP